MEWMIHQLAQRAGITSRTLRHYDRIGLLAPSRVGANGYRYYDLSAVVRVQRILWMRRLGMSLSAIAEVLSDQVDEQDGLVAHIAAMENERDRLDQRIRSAREALSLMRPEPNRVWTLFWRDSTTDTRTMWCRGGVRRHSVPVTSGGTE